MQLSTIRHKSILKVYCFKNGGCTADFPYKMDDVLDFLAVAVVRKKVAYLVDLVSSSCFVEQGSCFYAHSCFAAEQDRTHSIADLA